MKRWFGPSLRRRVVAALLLAFCLVAVVLAAREFATSTNSDQLDRVVADFSRGVMGQLGAITDPAEARGVVEALETQVNRGYGEAGVPSVLAMQLWDRSGTLVHGSTHLAELAWDGAAGIARVNAQGRVFHVFRAQDTRWRLVVAQPAIERTWILKSIVSDLAVSMLIAFPIVLVPLWVAVSQGLRPLNQLSQRIAARDPDDLAEIGFTSRHAELQPLVRSLDGLIARLRGKVLREHEFVHDAAHELRTPLAVISAQAHAVAHALDADERKLAAARLDDAIARASNLVEQLLQLARFDGQAASRATMDVARVAQDELALLEPSAFARGLELSLEAPDELAWPIELAAFRAILHNLVGNAIRYVPARGRIVVGLTIDSDVLQLTVEDDGQGIPAAQRESVFERFVRGAGHDVSGSGLGLAIVRQAAARLGGSVRLVDGMARAAGGRGCRFEVTFDRQDRSRSSKPSVDTSGDSTAIA